MTSFILSAEHSQFYLEWTELIEGSNLSEPVSGIYKVFAVNNEERINICRLISSDPTGIIYIGQSTNLGLRLLGKISLEKH